MELTYDFAPQTWTLNVNGVSTKPMPFDALTKDAAEIEAVGFYLANGAPEASIDGLSITKITPSGVTTVYADGFDSASAMCSVKTAPVDAGLCFHSPGGPELANPLSVSPMALGSVASSATVVEGDCTASVSQTLPDDGRVWRCSIEFGMDTMPSEARDRLVKAELVLTESTSVSEPAASVELLVGVGPADLYIGYWDSSDPVDEVGQFIAHSDVADEEWRFDVTERLKNALLIQQDLGFQVRLGDETPGLNHGVSLGDWGASGPKLVLELAGTP